MKRTNINDLIQQFADYTELYDRLQKELRAAKAQNNQDDINKYTARIETVEYLLGSKSIAIQKAVVREKFSSSTIIHREK